MTVRSSDAITFGLSVGCTASKLVAHSVAVDVGTSRLKDILTAQQHKRAGFEMASPTSPRIQSQAGCRTRGTKSCNCVRPLETEESDDMREGEAGSLKR